MAATDPLPLTPTQLHVLTSYIRGGAFPRVAAEMAGVPGAVLEFCLQWATDPAAPEEYRALLCAVRNAQAQARGAAETKLYRDKPLDWLKHGPGKPGDLGDGWTQPARAGPSDRDSAEVDWLALPQVRQVLAGILEALAPHPEALAAVVAALNVLSPPASTPGA